MHLALRCDPARRLRLGEARAQYEAESAWFAARGPQVLALPTGQGVFVKVP